MRLNGGDEISINVGSASTTFVQVKQIICNSDPHGVAPPPKDPSWRLLFAGLEVTDEQTLADYDIEEEAVLSATYEEANTSTSQIVTQP